MSILKNFYNSRIVLTAVFLLVIQNPEIPKLKKNEIKIDYSKDENGYRIVDAYALVKADPLTIISVIADYENYPDFMPRVKSTDIYYMSLDSAHYRTDLKMPWPLNDIWYVISVKSDTVKYEIRWVMLEGNILDTKGFWKLRESENGSVLVIYHAEVLLDSGFPEFAVRIVQKKTVKNILKAIRKRAEAIGR